MKLEKELGRMMMMKRKTMNKLVVLTAGAVMLGAGVHPAETLAKTPVSQAKVQKKVNTFYKVTTTANVRATASMKGKVIEWAPKNSVVESLEKRGQWVKIKQDGKIGYVHQNSLKKINASDVEQFRYQFVANNLKGFKSVGNGKYVSSLPYGGIVMVEFHEESTENVSVTISNPRMFNFTDDTSYEDGIEETFERFEIAIRALLGENSPEYKDFTKKSSYFHGEEPAKTFKVGNRQIRIDESRIPYETRVTFTKDTLPVKMTARHVVESSKATKLKSKRASTSIPNGTRMMKIGETKDELYVQMGNKTGFVPKRDILSKVDEVKTSNKTLSREQMNAALTKVSQRVNDNHYIVKDGKETVAQVSFSSSTSLTPKLVLSDDVVEKLAISNLDESFAWSKKEMDERKEAEVEIIDGNVTVSVGEIKDTKNEFRQEYLYSKEEIIEAKRVRKLLTPVVSSFSTIQLGDTKEGRSLKNKIFFVSHNPLLTVNGKQLMVEIVEDKNGDYTIEYKLQ